MSALTKDLDLPSVDVAAGRLYDPAFKLFGRTIPVSSDIPAAAIDGRYQASRTMVTGSGDASSVQDAEDENPVSDDENFMPDELGSSSGSNDGGDQLKVVELIKDKREGSALISDDPTQNDGNHLCAPNADERNKADEPTELHAHKRPEKPIPCPRCHSLDTKFCYFNNYNVNQPRHFCKNCQRYWTAGGTLRNVPVGAGRRKNKHSSAHFRSALPDFVVARGDSPENAQQVISCSSSVQMGMNGPFKAGLSAASAPLQEVPLDLQPINSFEDQPSSAVLSFGQESPLCVSTRGSSFTPCRSEVLQGYKPEMIQPQVKYPLILPSIGGPQCERSFSEAIPRKEAALNTVALPVNGDAKLQKLLVKTSATEKSLEPEGSVCCNPEPEPAGLGDFRKCVDAALAWATNGPFSFMGLPWQYGAGLGWANTSPPAGHGSAGLGLIPNTSAGLGNMWQGASGSCSTGSDSPHGGGFGGPAPWAPGLGPWAAAIPWPIMQNPMWVPPGWGGPWTMPWAAPLTAAATAAAAAAADLGTTTLGKHAREPEDASDGERCRPLLVPKTLRIDDPGEAARSSIWSTLGIDLCADRLTGGGMFRGLQCKTYVKDNDPHAHTRNSNPAAIGRLLNFQESNLSVPTLDTDDK